MEKCIKSSLIGDCVMIEKGLAGRQLCFTKNGETFLVITFYKSQGKFMVQAKHDNMVYFLDLFKEIGQKLVTVTIN